MRVAMGRYLAPIAADNSATSLPGYRDALRQIVGALGGHLVT